MTTVNEYYKELFGKKVYKISLDAHCTCPTRDGTKGRGGCIFCSQSGSGDFATSDIKKAKEIVSRKLKNKDVAYIAYFQNFTNTYGDINRLKALWYDALKEEGVIGLALGTRPDCLSEECIRVLKEISEKYFVQIELGLQTVNNNTAKYIRRGYETPIYKDAVMRLHKANPNIHVVTHIMFGLPTIREDASIIMETKEDMTNTVQYAVDCGTDGIKITNLYILKNTDLEKEYMEGKIKYLSMDEYIELLKEALKIIPENIIIHRLTGDPPKALIIEPKWCTNKKLMLNEVNKLLCKGSHSK